mmetsp:Transcript_6168/g.25868  ORF Transcript_6168/g.25868 Transcript_6168/m.25868 type:complete len:190 (+) Transcript_6168:302-871(+)
MAHHAGMTACPEALPPETPARRRRPGDPPPLAQRRTKRCARARVDAIDSRAVKRLQLAFMATIDDAAAEARSVGAASGAATEVVHSRRAARPARAELPKPREAAASSSSSSSIGGCVDGHARQTPPRTPRFVAPVTVAPRRDDDPSTSAGGGAARQQHQHPQGPVATARRMVVVVVVPGSSTPPVAAVS